METALDVVMIILSVALIFVVLLQTKGSSFSGAFGGDSGSIYKTRRGFEQSLFQSTIVLAIVWVVIAAITSVVS